MKKLFTLLSALLYAWSVQAQTLTFQHEGKDIENGATVYSSKINEDLLHIGDQMGKPAMNALQFMPEITLTSSVDASNVHVTLESIDDPKVDLELCSFDGTCSSGTLCEKKGELVANVAVDAQIHTASVRPADQIITRRALVSAWYEGQEANKVSFTLVMTNDETVLGIDGVQASKAHVSMQGNVMHYALDGEGVHTLYLYGLDGAMVMSRTLAGNEGQVSLSSLRKGIYLYQIAGKSGSKAQGKIIVK